MMVTKPDPLMILGFTSGKSLEVSEEDGIRIQRIIDLPLQHEHRPRWIEVTDIYGSECKIRTDIICLFALESEETKSNYQECNPD